MSLQTQAVARWRPSHPRRLVAWSVGGDTGWAAAALLGMWAGYLGTARTESPWPLYLAVLIVGTALPAYVVFHRLRGTWADLGVTRHRLWPSLILAVLLGGASLPKAIQLAQEQGADPIAHLVGNVFVFWEPFFFFGWLFLRFEKAFGALAAPALVAISFAVMHVGAVPLAQAAAFGGAGLLFAIIFALTRNLAILWPLAYPVTSAIGTLQADLAFGWDVSIAGAALLAAQLVTLYAVARAAATR